MVSLILTCYLFSSSECLSKQRLSYLISISRKWSEDSGNWANSCHISQVNWSFKSNMEGPHEYSGNFLLSQNLLLLILLLNRCIFKVTCYLTFIMWLYLMLLPLTVSLISSWTTLLRTETFLSINQSGFPWGLMYVEFPRLFLSTHQ